MKEAVHADRVQLTYASVLGIASTLGMILIAAGYVLYVFELLPSSASAADIAAHWHLRASELHHAVHVPSGWDWTGQLGRGDVLSYVSIIYLSASTIFCLAFIVPAFIREKDQIYTVITILQVCVLVFAATGIISGGH
ncbi:MAG: DUF1634 domain-containing protein [Chlorobi bacterium]|nr:DUF1634 domain-containing protein [Chlorobiota bacterium]